MKTRSKSNFSIVRSLIAILVLAASPIYTVSGQTQPIPASELEAAVERFRTDERGPYRAIRWFCKDGSVKMPQERCAAPGGIQHALAKDETIKIAERNGIFLGQILAGQDRTGFLDAGSGYSRARQYELAAYLQTIDNGWIMERARYYRGAVQAEDEEAWGRGFLEWTLSDDTLLRQQFFWLRQLTKRIPHAAGERLIDRIRATAKEVADAYAPFTAARVKIHGQPDASDLRRVRDFRSAHAARADRATFARLSELERDLTTLYETSDSERLRRITPPPPGAGSARTGLGELLALLDNNAPAPEIATLAARLLMDIRTGIEGPVTGSQRLALMDLSVAVEDVLFGVVTRWPVDSTAELLEKNAVLARGAAGAGYLERWEWEQVSPSVVDSVPPALDLAHLRSRLESTRRVVEWGIGLVSAVYGPVIRLYAPFEAKANGYTDDILRGSILLPLGAGVSALADAVAVQSGGASSVMNLPGSGGSRGLNPGFAFGELRVIEGDPHDVELLPDRIYVMERPPGEMKPVAGIATVTEGNIVSHVQLLARNLGIPNAVFPPDVVTSLRAHEGERVFYAVSPRGRVILKSAESMTPEERALVEAKERVDERVRVPTTRLALDHTELTSLYALRASDSGRLCGPKAANLGQLSSMFAGQVAPGFIVPFGVFRSHMAQPMPATTGSYWDYLRSSFAMADRALASGTARVDVESRLLGRLDTLRSAIETMPLQDAFRESLGRAFATEFGQTIGQKAVFIRSDTNMEDLADFSGAGLNLTVPNVRSEADLLQAIRRVWASPYRERSYRWRQRYLMNPEDVYPSILVLASVNVDRSGVMITTGISSGDSNDVTVAFNRGVGGAVDGQAAESWQFGDGGEDLLLSPAREPTFRSLPPEGGLATQRTSFEGALLAAPARSDLRALAEEVRKRLPSMPGVESPGPFDVELGFLGRQIWLFQVRPFVENRSAGATTYLQHMDAAVRPRSPISR